MFWELFCCFFPLSICGFPLLTAAGFGKWRTGFSAVKNAFFLWGKKGGEGDIIVLITCRQIYCNFYLYFEGYDEKPSLLIWVWWKRLSWFSAEAWETVWINIPTVFDWTNTHRGHPFSVRTVSHHLHYMVLIRGVLTGFYRTDNCRRWWGRLFAGANSGVPLSFWGDYTTQMTALFDLTGSRTGHRVSNSLGMLCWQCKPDLIFNNKWLYAWLFAILNASACKSLCQNWCETQISFNLIK